MPAPTIRLARYEIRIGRIGVTPGIALLAVEHHANLPAGLLAVWAVAAPAKPLRWSTAGLATDPEGHTVLTGPAGAQVLRAVPLAEHEAAPDPEVARALARALPALRSGDAIRAQAYGQLPAAFAAYYPDAAVAIEGDQLEVLSGTALPARGPDGAAPAAAGAVPRRGPALSRRGGNNVWV